MEQEGKPKIVSLSKNYLKNSMQRRVRTVQGETLSVSDRAMMPRRTAIIGQPLPGRSVLINPSSSTQLVKLPSAPFKLIAPNRVNQSLRCVIFKDGQGVNVRKSVIPRQTMITTMPQLVMRPNAIKRHQSQQIVTESSLESANWRISRSASDTPRQYGRQQRIEEIQLDDDNNQQEELGGVHEYLFGSSKKRSRTPSPVREVVAPEIVPRQSRRKQNPQVLKDVDEIIPEVEKKTETDKNTDNQELDESILNLILWENGIGMLPGLEGVKFRINKYNLLTVFSPDAEEMNHVASGKQELLVCTQCGTYGMSSEFVEKRFCSRDCIDERQRRKAELKRWKETRRKRKDTHKIIIKKLQAGHRLLSRQNLSAAASVIYVELLRQRMSKEQIKLEMTDKKLNYKLYPDAALYAEKVSDKAAPANLFRDPIPNSKNPFKLGWKLEAIDPRHPALICVVSVIETRGYRVKLRFDGYGAQHDFWVNANSCEIFQPGWCERTDHNLTPPRGWDGAFNWTIYLEKNNATAAPRHAFAHSQERTVTPSGFRVGMKLEAVDKNFTRNICTATILDVIDNRILIHIDGTSYEHDYWADNCSPYIHPAGWCSENKFPLYHTPNGKLCRWDHLLDGKAFMAPARAFKIRLPHELKIGHKIEAVDKRNPELIRIATIIDTQPHQIRIKFDGWPAQYAYWIDDDSTEYHPFGWCSRTGHPLEKPPGQATSSVGCQTPGCTGMGHAYRCGPDHFTSYTCPYSPENFLRDDIVPRRFQSFEEYMAVKNLSHSKGTKPRTLLSKRAKLEKKARKYSVDSNNTPPKKKEKEKEIEKMSPEKDDDIKEQLGRLKQEIAEKIGNFQINPRAWDIEEVEKFINEILGSKGGSFRDELVDGEALLMLSKQDLIDCLGLKVGPAITLYNCIKILRKRALDCESI